jgi:hypothetical protein
MPSPINKFESRNKEDIARSNPESGKLNVTSGSHGDGGTQPPRRSRGIVEVKCAAICCTPSPSSGEIVNLGVIIYRDDGSAPDIHLVNHRERLAGRVSREAEMESLGEELKHFSALVRDSGLEAATPRISQSLMRRVFREPISPWIGALIKEVCPGHE